MNKILFFAPRFHTNQVNIIKGLNKISEVHFHCIFKGKTENYDFLKPRIITQSKISKFLQIFLNIHDFRLIYFPEIIKYFNLLKKLKPDIIIIRVYGRIYIYFISLISKILNIKIIYYDQFNLNLNHLKKKNIINQLKLFELNFRHFFFKSLTFSPIPSKNIKYDKLFHLPFVADRIKKKFYKKKGKIRILIISKFQKRKNIIFAFNILDYLHTKFSFEVTFIGEVSSKENKKIFQSLKEKIINSEHNSKYEIYKNIPFNQMRSFYNKSDIFLLASSDEPASVSILEAMSYGLSVICSDTCSTKSYLPKKKNNIFKSENSEDLIKCLKFYLCSKKELYKNQILNYNYCNKKYLFNNYLLKFKKILKKIEK